ncbi:MAG: oxidoreductase [Treponema sp. GWB1_62_6]|nr:MAG: oxidoreductase [Treponema sp. GWA1_62_8]OHE64714.1 MAG: oxidoreductase [Treponema sp. GWC1_61_84]OHE67739.1 MAG: oxidoreductase [Treponema sp. GWB1_62_6]OHE75621.1 MAG: oxidoreductase [Treponema sp. RIFOXYC1_FULL_61_9]HCM27549.1 oxidoreductase [Treponema sp.]
MIEGGTSSGTASRLRYGMVGGGQGAFIGDVHRKAIALDASAELAAGCFSRDPANTRETGKVLRIPADRLYSTFEEMAEEEAKRADRIDFAVIVTPNALHYAAAKAFLARGIHVVCDKPLTFEVAEAEELAALAKRNKLLFCVTYTYTGYPAVKHARELIARGEIGELRFVNAEYPQEWLATAIEKDGQKQASWRTDPALAGKSNCVGDIGSHAENMVSYLTGLRIKSVCARLDSFLPERRLDDNASIMVEYVGGAKGLYWSSQIAVGYDNALRVRVFGSAGSIQWSQENPNYLTVSKLGEPTVTLSRGRDSFFPHAQSYSRIPSGHPEGYFEAFANIYKTFASALATVKAGGTPSAAQLDFPSADEGIDGVKFIGKCVESSQKGAVWIDFH